MYIWYLIIRSFLDLVRRVDGEYFLTDNFSINWLCKKLDFNFSLFHHGVIFIIIMILPLIWSIYVIFCNYLYLIVHEKAALIVILYIYACVCALKMEDKKLNYPVLFWAKAL